MFEYSRNPQTNPSKREFYKNWTKIVTESLTLIAAEGLHLRLHLIMGLAFWDEKSAPNRRSNYTLLGAGHIHFEVFFHWVTSWQRFNGLLDIT